MTTPKTKFEGLALTALREWRPLAEQGNANAQFRLGFMYEKGLGVPQDYAQAHMWFDLAASKFSPGEDREFGFRCGHGIPPCGGFSRVYRKSY